MSELSYSGYQGMRFRPSWVLARQLTITHGPLSIVFTVLCFKKNRICEKLTYRNTVYKLANNEEKVFHRSPWPARLMTWCEYFVFSI